MSFGISRLIVIARIIAATAMPMAANGTRSRFVTGIRRIPAAAQATKAAPAAPKPRPAMAGVRVQTFKPILKAKATASSKRAYLQRGWPPRQPAGPRPQLWLPKVLQRCLASCLIEGDWLPKVRRIMAGGLGFDSRRQRQRRSLLGLSRSISRTAQKLCR